MNLLTYILDNKNKSIIEKNENEAQKCYHISSLMDFALSVILTLLWHNQLSPSMITQIVGGIICYNFGPPQSIDL